MDVALRRTPGSVVLSHYLKSSPRFHFGSVVMYDKLLRLKFPVGLAIVGFAYDITLEVYCDLIGEVELTTA